MQLFALFVVLVIAVPFLLYAGPVILYVVPFIVIGLVISYIHEVTRNHHGTRAH